MSLFNKTAPWFVASILAATSAFAQHEKSTAKKCPPCTPCEFKEMLPGMPGYNAPSGTNVCGAWDFFATGSFIYWQVAQDNMAFAQYNTNTLAQIPSPGIQGSYAEMSFAYKPGFKVAVGMNYNYDNWDSYAEYTRVHGTSSSHATAPTGGSLLANSGSLYLLGQATKSQVYQTASSSFKTNLDFIDWVLGRNYFVGKNLTFHPIIGARGSFITQSRSVHYKNLPAGGLTGTNGGIAANYASNDVYSRVHSWGVGARTGLETNWLLGEGIRIFGNGYADMLYTKYKLQEKSILTLNTTGASQYQIGKERIGLVRTHLDLELGLGWGSYFDNNNWHVDLSAAYGFQVFFNQNMFRNYLSGTVAAPGITASGDMTIQGLTVTARLDF